MRGRFWFRERFAWAVSVLARPKMCLPFCILLGSESIFRLNLFEFTVVKFARRFLPKR